MNWQLDEHSNIISNTSSHIFQFSNMASNNHHVYMKMINYEKKTQLSEHNTVHIIKVGKTRRRVLEDAVQSTRVI